jgi:hypothetical protein
MITFNSEQVRIVSGDEHERLATIEDADRRIHVVAVERLRGTRGGIMEVVVRWREALRNSQKESKP